jgi:hypothetical protein
MTCRERTDCLVISCEVAWFMLGSAIAGTYIYYVFGTDTVAGEQPRQLASVDVSPVGCPVHVHAGSLYLFKYRVHHWMISLCVLPVSVACELYWLIGACVVTMLHGLSYQDRFQFKYSVPCDGDAVETDTSVHKPRCQFLEDFADNSHDLLVIPDGPPLVTDGHTGTHGYRNVLL